MKKYTNIGGQALIEGIMMRNQDRVAIAIRRADGEIALEKQTIPKAHGLLRKTPLLRGVFALIASMKIGIRALTLSAKYFEEDAGIESEESRFDQWLRKVFGNHAEDVIIFFSMVTALALAILLFTALPTLIISSLRGVVGSPYLLSIFEGILKMIFFITYILLISRMKDVHRVFQYHGAEHKTIHNIESGLELSVENARTFTTLHPRCGTSFLIFVLAISILIFSFITWSNIFLRIGLKIILLPLIAGISFEVLKLSGKSDNALIRAIAYPGLMMQKITTKEPDDEMLELAIAAVKAVMDEE